MTSLALFVMFEVCKTSILGNNGMEVFSPLAKSLKEVRVGGVIVFNIQKSECEDCR
jgi:hypothetical protein